MAVHAQRRAAEAQRLLKPAYAKALTALGSEDDLVVEMRRWLRDVGGRPQTT